MYTRLRVYIRARACVCTCVLCECGGRILAIKSLSHQNVSHKLMSLSHQIIRKINIVSLQF